MRNRNMRKCVFVCMHVYCHNMLWTVTMTYRSWGILGHGIKTLNASQCVRWFYTTKNVLTQKLLTAQQGSSGPT